MTKILFFIAVVLIASLRNPAEAQAARLATVDRVTKLYKGPKETSQVLRELPKGTRLTASTYPTEGFYKVRTVQKELGWVKADILVLDRAATTGSDPKPSGDSPPENGPGPDSPPAGGGGGEVPPDPGPSK
jgi:uncharacterized protein YgiM (DUF1202 family)